MLDIIRYHLYTLTWWEGVLVSIMVISAGVMLVALICGLMFKSIDSMPELDVMPGEAELKRRDERERRAFKRYTNPPKT